MVDLVHLLQDIVVTLRACPEVLAEVDQKETAIAAYLDEATTLANALTRFVYQMPNGTVLVAWSDSGVRQTEQQYQWQHSVDIYARALRGKSPLTLINAIMDGTPAGDELRWRYLCVNDCVLPVDITEIRRDQDEEGIDYYVIRTVFTEKGDLHYGVPCQ